MNYYFKILVTFLFLIVVSSHAVASDSYDFDCVESNTGLEADLNISGVDGETLKIQSKNKAINFVATLDEAEDSSYFYMTAESYTIVVSQTLMVTGEGYVTIEDDGEPLEGGSFYCTSR